MSSLASFVSPPVECADRTAAGTTLERTRHAAFHSLAPGTVEPRGWLHLYLRKQAQQLASQLPNVSWPFSDAYWAGDEHAPNVDGWWPWEQKAYWIDGALRCAFALGDERLLKQATHAIEYTLSHVDADGYLGPTALKQPHGFDQSDFRWPHAVFFRALIAYAEATGDGRVASMIQRHYLARLTQISYGGWSRNVVNVEAILWVYGQTGDPRMLELAQSTWDDFLRSVPPGERESGDLHPDRVFANDPITAHGVTYIEKAKLPVLLYMHTGNADYLRYALATQQRIFSHHMLLDGIPSASEDYRGTTSLDAHETCDITDHTWAWGYFLEATGDGIWGDRIERACFNAGFGAIKKDWKAVQYFSGPNQVIATDSSSHVPYIDEAKGWMAFRPNPGENTACCGGNVHRFFPNYVIRMWMRDAEGGLAAALYGASTIHVRIGASQEPIEIEQMTDYPFGEQIDLTVRGKKPVFFPLSLRIPAWCKQPSLAVNGHRLALPPIRRGFVRLERTFNPGDRITLKLPMHLQISSWPEGGTGIEFGPLVYSLPIEAQWTPLVAPKWSTTEFPEWNATPNSPWNYGLGIAAEDLGAQTKVQRRTMAQDPWVSPPLRLVVPMKQIDGWALRTDPNHPEREQTPPLPNSQPSKSSPLEWITLLPYGATHLRLSIFPRG